MVVRMARGFARLEFPSTYTMLRDSLVLPQWEQAQAHMVAGMGQEKVDALLAQLSTAAAYARDS